MKVFCLCGGRKNPSQIVCDPCWDSAPERIHRTWGTAAAKRELMAHASARRPKTETPVTATQIDLL